MKVASCSHHAPCSFARRSRSLRGFTLVEMLIVIAVIGILAAILLPVLSRVREAGRRSACTSNMRQLGMAFTQYVQDNNQKLPLAIDGGFGANKAGGWTYYTQFGSGDGTDGASNIEPKFDPTKGSLYPYAKSVGIYRCPSDGDAQKNGGETTGGQTYAANSCVFFKSAASVCGGAANGDCRVGKSMVRFRNPTEWMLLGEEARDSTRPTSTDDAYLNLKDETQDIAFQNYFSKRHSNGSVITFLDGHSKWYSQADILKNRFQIGGPQVDAAKTLAKGCPSGVQ